MPYRGPIVLIEDDLDDQELLGEIFTELELPNELLFFSLSTEAYQYLKTTSKKPFLIICDINLPGLNGVKFKQQIDKDPELRNKCIPFVFLSTASTETIVNEAYATTSIQGFFEKSTRINGLKETMSTIVQYWKISKQTSLL